MKIRSLTAYLLVASFSSLMSSKAQAQLQIEKAFPNLRFSRPVDFQAPNDGTNRIFVVEQAGLIKVFPNDRDVQTAGIFLDIRKRVDARANEMGLLGLAFHPDFKNNGLFFVNYTASNPRRTIVSKFQAPSPGADKADPDSEVQILVINQPYSNHNGGQLAFGPDGYLYIALGDGGAAGDPQGHGQNPATLLGAILRIDVNNPTGGLPYSIPDDNPFAGNTEGIKEEIYAYGLRNPWRFSFDPQTGWLWAADVGQDAREEINLIESGKNYGWNIMEGSLCFSPPTGCNKTGLELPIWEYDHTQGHSITGGYVYRGKNVPELYGKYIYADFISGNIWALQYDGKNPPKNELLLASGLNISSFGVDSNYELYICAFDGYIYRFKPTVTSVPAQPELPGSAILYPNYPNPFNPATTLSFSLHRAARVRLEIYSIQGALIKVLVDKPLSAGFYEVEWNGTTNEGQHVPSGLYLAFLRINQAVADQHRLILIK